MNDQAPSRPTQIRFLILGLLMALTFVGHFNRVSISVAGTEKMLEEFEVSSTQMGTVYSAYLFFYTLCMVPGGWFIDRCGGKFALATMAICSVPLVLGTGMVRPLAAVGVALPALWTVRSLLGMASAPLHPAAARMVWTWTPAGNRNVSNGLVTAAALLAYAATPPLFGAMIDRFDWPTAFAVCSVVTAILATVWIICAGDSPARHRWANADEQRLLVVGSAVAADAEQRSVPGGVSATAKPHTAPRTGAHLQLETAPSRQRARPWWTLLTNRSLLLLSLSFAAVGYFQYLFFFWMEHYLSKELHLSDERSRNYTAVCMLAMAAGMFLGGRASDRLSMRFGPRVGRAVLPIAGMLASALFLAIGMVATEPRWIVAWLSFALGALGTGEASFWTTAIELGGFRGGSSAAIVNTGGNLGGVVAPVLTPLLGEHFGWPCAMGVAGVMCAFGAMLWLIIDPHERVEDRFLIPVGQSVTR